jgi:hypothetical protein
LTPVPGVDGAALDSDILAQAEAIRRERLERRQKKAEVKEKEVLVGNLIGEDHVNYVLMYNMLTGIRIGVSRCLDIADSGITMPSKDQAGSDRGGLLGATQVLV